VFVQHGTVLFSLDRDKMFSLLKVPRDMIADKGVASPDDRVAAVSEITSVTRAELLASLQRSFCRWKEWYEQPPGPRETARAVELARERYADPAWTRSR
jgi:lipoate-protein ligase A